MKKAISKFLKIVFYFTIILLTILLVFGLVLILDWPLWVAFFILSGIVGLTILFILIRKIWLKKRERKFIQQVIDQDELYMKGLAQQERDNLQQIQKKWKESIEAIKGSRLKKQGNPLYVLPWYMVIGESGTGKTTAIKAAKLASPFAEINQISGISGTRNFDWWFFEQAIVLDTAGRWSIPIDEGRDKEEWQRFINLLVKYRKKEPINGVIITIAANKLLESGVDVLERDGINLRKRIMELMRILGTRPPIYVLVTKCDLIQGMTQFCSHIPEKSLEQAMGVINKNFNVRPLDFLGEAINKILDRLRDFRLLLVQQSDTSGLDPALLLFPEEFGNLRKGLEVFFKGAFTESVYQETVPLRGIFFSSGHQEGAPFSHFLQALGFIQEKEMLQPESKGLFLHDFFSKILPKDRDLFAPTQLAVEFRKITKNLALTAWITLGLALCGLLSFSFVNNMHILRELPKNPPVLNGVIVDDMATMDNFMDTIDWVREQNSGWMPRFGLNHSRKVERKLKQIYIYRFKEGFLADLDKEMAERIDKFSNTIDEYVIGQYVTHLIRRINLLKACNAGASIDELLKKPQPTFDPLMLNEQEPTTAIEAEFGKLYLYYLVWRMDFGEIDEDLKYLQSWLERLLSLEGAGLHWLVTWANNQESLQGVSLDDFWEGSLALQDPKKIPPAFTSEAKEKIDAFFEEVESALPEPGPLVIASEKKEFYEWYREAYFRAWLKFGEEFSKGEEKLKNADDWLYTAAKMPTDDGPYFNILNRMAEELQALTDEKDMIVPAWIDYIYAFQEIKEESQENKEAPTDGSLGRGIKKQLEKRLKTRLKSKTRNLVVFDEQKKERASNAFADYKNALADLATIASSKNLSYQTAKEVFGDEMGGKSPIFTAQKAILDLKNVIGAGGREEKIFWDLIAGPTEYLWKIIRNQTACYLQIKWEDTVLSEIAVLSSGEAIEQLLKEGGFAWQFVKKEGPAEPFIGWSTRSSGYYPIKARGETLPFTSKFFSFLNSGRKQVPDENYTVKIKVIETSVNEGGYNPESIHLVMRCMSGAETQHLDYYQFPVTGRFNWSRKDCEDVTFTIKVKGDIELKINYTGKNAFPNFLAAFRRGKRRLRVKEFPEYESRLRSLGISYIDVEFEFSGHGPVIDILNVPTNIPKKILECWDYSD